MRTNTYLQQKATPWVSKLVLFGCVLITIALTYSAIQANALGERFSTPSYELEDL
jgi:hypothetical protein